MNTSFPKREICHLRGFWVCGVTYYAKVCNENVPFKGFLLAFYSACFRWFGIKKIHESSCSWMKAFGFAEPLRQKSRGVRWVFFAPHSLCSMPIPNCSPKTAPKGFFQSFHGGCSQKQSGQRTVWALSTKAMVNCCQNVPFKGGLLAFYSACFR